MEDKEETFASIAGEGRKVQGRNNTMASLPRKRGAIQKQIFNSILVSFKAFKGSSSDSVPS
jgi:hypothetical protein